MQRIAQALGVAVGTVHNDLEGFSTPEKPSRPKGGRPKGSRPKKSAHEKAVLLRDAGVSKKDIAKEVGIGFMHSKHDVLDAGSRPKSFQRFDERPASPC